MMFRSTLTFGISCAVVMTAQAQEAQTSPRAQIEGAYATLLSGDLQAAKSGFQKAATDAPEGSTERWLAEQLVALTSSLREADLPKAPFDTAPLTVALGLSLEQKPLEAQIAFLSAATLAPKGSSNRDFAKKLARIAEAQENGMQASNALDPIKRTDIPTTEENNAAGMFTMIFTGASLGVGAGVLADVDLEIAGAAALAIPLVTGVLGGLGGYAYTKVKHKEGYSFERAGAVAVGALLGTAEGILISTLNNAAIIDKGRGGDVTFLGAVAGTVAGAVVSELRPGDRGDAFLMFSTALWTTALAAEGFGLVLPEQGNGLAATLTVGYNLGIVAGVAGALTQPISYRRLRIINGSGVLGTAAGALVGGIIATGADFANADNEVRTVVGGAMVGSLSGLTTGYLLTRKLAPESEKRVEGTPGFQGMMFGNAQGLRFDDKPMTLNAHFSF
jgi:hypothetical protein